MQGSLGEKIGEGAMADVHAWAPGQVVKLCKPGIPHWVLQHEARMTRAVFAAGGRRRRCSAKSLWMGASASCCRASMDRP